MAILVDPPMWPLRGLLFSHVASDVSIAELHEFAARVGLHPQAYDGDHYDVSAERYDDVVAAGARPVSNRELLAAIRVAGLRFRKRRGERPVGSVPDALGFVGVPHRFELLSSTLEPPEATTVAAVVFVSDARQRLLLTRHASRDGWEAPGGWREPGESVRAGAAREVHEETGVHVGVGSLVRVGYERIRCDVEPAHPRLHRVSHVAVFAARHPSVGVGGTGPEGRAFVWQDAAGLRRRCRAAPWWPLLERYVEDNLVSSAATLPRARSAHDRAPGRA